MSNLNINETKQKIDLEKRNTFPPKLNQGKLSDSFENASNGGTKHKLPQIILQFIIKQTKQIRLQQQLRQGNKTLLGQKISKLKLSRGLNKKYNKQLCLICQTTANQLMSIGFCNHKYCNSCLHQYIIYKINMFEAIQCPFQNCKEMLNEDSRLYSQLPLEVRKKFKKIKQYQQSQKQGKRLCPNQTCDGVLDLTDKFFNPVCPNCKKTFCSKCYFQMHEGDCDPYQLNFFQDTLHFRQCKKCKNVIEKVSGCNHMTCKCGYQFCYICGGLWRSDHICKNPQNQAIAPNRHTICCFECQCQCCSCCYDVDCNNCCDRCCDYCCDGCCGGVSKIFAKVFFFIIWIAVILPLFLFMGIFYTLMWLSISIFGGMLVYPCIMIQQLQGFLCVLSIVFYPITMIIGAVVGLKQIFCEVFKGDVYQMFGLPFALLSDICNQ